MKTFTKITSIVVVGVALSLSALAAPPSKSIGPSRRLVIFEKTTPAPRVPQSERAGLTCERMLVPRAGISKRPQYVFVTCTPEMMRTDVRCQQACGAKS